MTDVASATCHDAYIGHDSLSIKSRRHDHVCFRLSEMYAIHVDRHAVPLWGLTKG